MQATTRYQLAGSAVHLLTASAIVLGFFTLVAITRQAYLWAFFLNALSIVIDAVDGTLARRARVLTYIPNIDGALMDNIADFLNYVITPCFLAYNYAPMLPAGLREIIIVAVLLSSAYQFTQADAKTDDHFFKGFPSYWNIVIFYFYLYHTSPWLNAGILLGLVVMVFVPIKYLYLSRMDHAIHNRNHRWIILGLSALWGLAILGMLLTYPNPWPIFLYYSLLYTLGYTSLSLYFTFLQSPS